MSEDLVTYELDGKVALLGLNRPEKRNAISDELLEALRAAVQRAEAEAAAGVIFGHGQLFCAGLDLAGLAARIASGPQKPHQARARDWHRTFDMIARGAIPWVAALHGAVVGGGLELAAATHIRVGDRTTTFGLPEGQRGIFVGGGGSVRIQRLIGFATMADMMLTGRLYDADEALQLRVLQYVTASGDAVMKARELAAKIAENVPLTNWQIINLLPRIGEMSHEEGLFMEMMGTLIPRPPEALERLQDFLSKRAKPLDVNKTD